MASGVFNDEKAGINSSGYLTLGVTAAQSSNNQGPITDGAADATYAWMKNDFWVQVDPLTLPVALPSTNNTETNVRSAANLWNRTYTAGGSVAAYSFININRILPFARTYATALHGFKLIDMILSYTVATAGATSVAVAFATETAQANNSARAVASATPLGAVTYQNPIGTVVSTLPVSTQASPYVCKIVLGTPVAIATDRQTLSCEILWTLPNTCVVAITEIAFHFALGIY